MIIFLQHFDQGGQEPKVRSTLRAIWLLVPEPFSEPTQQNRDLLPVLHMTELSHKCW